MAPLFDQDSASRGENRPTEGAGSAMAGQSGTEPREEASGQRAGYQDGSDAVRPGASDAVDESDPDDGVDGKGTPVKTPDVEDRVGDGETNPPAVTGAGPGDTTAGAGAADGTIAPHGTDEAPPPLESTDDAAPTEQVEAEQVEPETEPAS